VQTYIRRDFSFVIKENIHQLLSLTQFFPHILDLKMSLGKRVKPLWNLTAGVGNRHLIKARPTETSEVLP